ncbi:MAG: MFS transporter [Hyphomonas sp.]|uniref:spinster family MFS transporter n=1 Tax=Hyphomonas sp. TaxID=87 RepID=UPI003526E326
MTDAASAAPTERPGHETGYGTPAYRAYVLFALLVVYIFNFIDRSLLSVLGEPIRETFGLSDTQIGLLSGLAFAVLYTFLGIPFAMLAERRRRTTIIAAAMAFWSLMTAACGMAQNTFQFTLARIGVGVGEAGCSPPSHSLISDYFPQHKRSTALSIYALGIPIGAMIASVGGAWIATREGLDWRDAFIYLGLPGVALALVFRLTVKEPPRGYSDPGGAAAEASRKKPSPFAVFGKLSRNASFWHVSVGGGLASLAGYGIGQFIAPYWLRVFGLNLMEAALIYGLVLGIAASFGTFFSGYLADKLRPKHPNSDSWLPALGLACAVPFYLVGYNLSLLGTGVAIIAASLPLMMIGTCIRYSYLSSLFSVPQRIVPPSMRATAAALMLFVNNLIGLGLGPPIVGWFSDQGTKWHLSQMDAPISIAECSAGEMALKAVKSGKAHGLDEAALAEAAANVPAYCAPARATGVRVGISVGALFFLWAAVHFLLLGRTFRRDEWKHEGGAETA